MHRVLRFGLVLQLGMLLGLLSFVRSLPAEPKVYKQLPENLSRKGIVPIRG